MPKALENAPTILPQNELYLEAFYNLSLGRQNTDNTVNPISFSDVMLYCDCKGIESGYERMRYWRFVTNADQEYISHMLEKREAQINKVANKK